MTTIKRIQDFIGNLWGKATTISVALAAAILAAPIPPELLNQNVRWVLFGCAVVVAAARHVAPPPATT